MKKVIIASHNPVKIQAAREAFASIFSGEDFIYLSVSVTSGVSRQPKTDQETLLGAFNRAQNAAKEIPKADYWVGIEGGINGWDEEMAAFAWVVVIGRHGIGKSRTGTFYLPKQVAELVRTGKELGEADDIVFDRENSKQDNGAVGLLTGNVVDRVQLYKQAVILALIPFKNPELY